MNEKSVSSGAMSLIKTYEYLATHLTHICRTGPICSKHVSLMDLLMTNSLTAVAKVFWLQKSYILCLPGFSLAFCKLPLRVGVSTDKTGVQESVFRVNESPAYQELHVHV